MAAGYCGLSASLARSVKVELPGAAARRCSKPGSYEAVNVCVRGRHRKESQLSERSCRACKGGREGRNKGAADVLVNTNEGTMSLSSKELLVGDVGVIVMFSVKVGRSGFERWESWEWQQLSNSPDMEL